MYKFAVLAMTLTSFACAHSGETGHATDQAHANGPAHWGYTGEGAPEHWGQLSPDYAICGSGKNQSPIDLDNFVEAELADISFAYSAGGQELINNGHTIQVNFAPGSSVSLDGQNFALKQYHFHSPSENTIQGQSFPLEVHLVHADAAGNLAVIAVMFSEGDENPALSQAWSLMPSQAGDKVALTTPVSAAEILPQDHSYYRFNGSLTTPPCSEGVRWLVMKTPVSVSAEQVKKFAELMQHPNNRPVQPVNARPVLQ